MNMKKLYLIMILIFALPIVSAKLEMDSISFDPAIIAAGDEVDIVIQFHGESYSSNEDRYGNPDYKFIVTLEPDDTLTQKYVTIQDAKGDNIQGSVIAGNYYNKIFRVKINGDAPAGNYEFKLTGNWYYKGEMEESSQQVKFKMPVKKEGIILDISTLNTFPGEVRPGDNYVKITGNIENVGDKNSKSIEINLELPEGLEPSYSDNNRKSIGGLKVSESKEVNFYVDIDENIEDGVYNIKYKFTYMDLDNNHYTEEKTIPFLIKSRPYLEVVDVQGNGTVGGTTKLYVTIKNTGKESAESVDVRIIKQNSQPFNIDVRSDYIGELEPGEEGIAVFDVKTNKEAQLKTHYFKLLVRSKGDSDEGDDNIYTYNRKAEFNVNSTAKNMNLYYGGGALGIILLFVIGKSIAGIGKSKSKKSRRK